MTHHRYSRGRSSGGLRAPCRHCTPRSTYPMYSRRYLCADGLVVYCRNCRREICSDYRQAFSPQLIQWYGFEE